MSVHLHFLRCIINANNTNINTNCTNTQYRVFYGNYYWLQHYSISILNTSICIGACLISTIGEPFYSSAWQDITSRFVHRAWHSDLRNQVCHTLVKKNATNALCEWSFISKDQLGSYENGVKMLVSACSFNWYMSQ